MTYRTAAEREVAPAPRRELSEDQRHALYTVAGVVGTCSVIAAVVVLGLAAERFVEWSITPEQTRRLIAAGAPTLIGLLFAGWVASIWWRGAR